MDWEEIREIRVENEEKISSLRGTFIFNNASTVYTTKIAICVKKEDASSKAPLKRLQKYFILFCFVFFICKFFFLFSLMKFISIF